MGGSDFNADMDISAVMINVAHSAIVDALVAAGCKIKKILGKSNGWELFYLIIIANPCKILYDFDHEIYQRP